MIKLYYDAIIIYDYLLFGLDKYINEFVIYKDDQYEFKNTEEFKNNRDLISGIIFAASNITGNPIQEIWNEKIRREIIIKEKNNIIDYITSLDLKINLYEDRAFRSFIFIIKKLFSEKTEEKLIYIFDQKYINEYIGRFEQKISSFWGSFVNTNTYKNLNMILNNEEMKLLNTTSKIFKSNNDIFLDKKSDTNNYFIYSYLYAHSSTYKNENNTYFSYGKEFYKIVYIIHNHITSNMTIDEIKNLIYINRESGIYDMDRKINDNYKNIILNPVYNEKLNKEFEGKYINVIYDFLDELLKENKELSDNTDLEIIRDRELMNVKIERNKDDFKKKNNVFLLDYGGYFYVYLIQKIDDKLTYYEYYPYYSPILYPFKRYSSYAYSGKISIPSENIKLLYNRNLGDIIFYTHMILIGFADIQILDTMITDYSLKNWIQSVYFTTYSDKIHLT
jgi:hypothetical protein